MKPVELSIGDWVNVLNYHWDGSPKTAQVDGITKKHGTYYLQFGSALSAEIDMCEPIPITPEILEKNGWKVKKRFVQYGKFGCGLLMLWNTEDNKILRNLHKLDINDFSDKGFRVRIECNYVHQLQHALRLCGIEKEIEL